MEERYLIDTSAFSRYLNGTLASNWIGFMDKVMRSDSPISIITRIELLSWTSDAFSELIIKDFISDTEILPLTEGIILKTIEIRRKTTVKLPDAIIAATAIVHNLILVSTNDRDFLKIENLKYQSLL